MAFGFFKQLSQDQSFIAFGTTQSVFWFADNPGCEVYEFNVQKRRQNKENLTISKYFFDVFSNKKPGILNSALKSSYISRT